MPNAPIPGLDREKCEQRNRIDGLRHGIEAIPIRFVGEELAAKGGLPATKTAAMERIHSVQPEGAEPLSPEDVYIHYGEAASARFISDRYGFLSKSTLQNIADGAARGVSFMGNHATGSMSHPGSYAIARTFAGKFEEASDDEPMRALFGMYMVRGVKPNGDNGPSTDDLDRMLRAGQIFDVSVGLRGGRYLCDVCGNGLYDMDEDYEYLCDHYPGSTRNMSAAQVKAQKQRGVPDGAASYTLDGAILGEISAVYDGAVPAAGFRKTLALARGGVDMELKDFGMALQEHVTKPLMAALGRRDDGQPQEARGADSDVVLPPPHEQAALAAVKAELAQVKEDLRKNSADAQFGRDCAIIDGWCRLPNAKMTPAEGEEWKKIAQESPAAFAAARPALDKRIPLSQLSREQRPVGVNAMDKLSGDPGDQLRQIADELQEKNPNLSRIDALNMARKKNPDLASAHAGNSPKIAAGGSE